MSEFSIRRATVADRQTVVALVSEMFGRDISQRYDWLYRDNPHGAALTWLAVSSGVAGGGAERAVAVTSIFPRRVMVAGRARLGSIGGDCYVVPAARRRGLATRLHQAALSGMREEGVDFMYGPPLTNNLHALIKAGSTRVGVFRRFSRPLSGTAAIKALLQRKPPPGIERVAGLPMKVAELALRASLRGIEIEVMSEAGDEVDAFTRRVTPPGVVCPVRDAAYLRWRYFAPVPQARTLLGMRRDGELVALVAYESRGDVAVVVDLYATNVETGDIGLQVAVERARSEGCDRIEFYVTPAVMPSRRLARRGFFPREDRVFQVAVSAEDEQHAVLTEPASWYFTEGDQDMQTCFTDQPT